MGIGVLLFYPTKKNNASSWLIQNLYHCHVPQSLPKTSLNKTSPSFHDFERCVFFFSNPHGVLASLALANLKGPTGRKTPSGPRGSRVIFLEKKNEWRNSADPILNNDHRFFEVVFFVGFKRKDPIKIWALSMMLSASWILHISDDWRIGSTSDLEWLKTSNKTIAESIQNYTSIDPK